MKSITREQLADFLITKWDYPPAQAPEAAEKLFHMDLSIRNAFELWMESNEFPDTPVFTSYSPKILDGLTHIKPPAIFLLLDWIRREPEVAIQAMREELIKE